MIYYANFDSLGKLVEIDSSQIVTDEYGSAEVANTEVPKELYDDYKLDPLKYIAGEKEIEIDVPDEVGEDEEQTYHKETITVPYPVINPDYESEKASAREAEFNKAFFNTSLGYVRRSVTMADGSKKDFLSDLLPVISMGVQAGQSVNILTYDIPTFDKDVTDWTEYQHQRVVTAQFIQECFLQLSADFAPINTEVENEDTTDQSEL